MLNNKLFKINKEVFENCSLQISKLISEREGVDYDACRFELNELKIICRSAKVTPKKIGQFVTFWKRNENGETEPFNEIDTFDFYVINVWTEKNFGQFVFPKSTLITKGIISTKEKIGKRGFRVYPRWDLVKNKQAEKTQKWQLKYFYEINISTDFTLVKELYLNK